jgi:hypothetical protein
MDEKPPYALRLRGAGRPPKTSLTSFRLRAGPLPGGSPHWHEGRKGKARPSSLQRLGHCEDIAALLYRRLRELGFSDDRPVLHLAECPSDNVAVYFVGCHCKGLLAYRRCAPRPGLRVLRNVSLFALRRTRRGSAELERVLDAVKKGRMACGVELLGELDAYEVQAKDGA